MFLNVDGSTNAHDNGVDIILKIAYGTTVEQTLQSPNCLAEISLKS